MRLFWRLKYASDGFSVAAAIAKRRALPDWYGECPETSEHEEFYVEAFLELDTCRFEARPLPWTALDAYATRYQFGMPNFQIFHSAIRAIDSAFLELAPRDNGVDWAKVKDYVGDDGGH